MPNLATSGPGGRPAPARSSAQQLASLVEQTTWYREQFRLYFLHHLAKVTAKIAAQGKGNAAGTEARAAQRFITYFD